jgi:hypothetical protein
LNLAMENAELPFSHDWISRKRRNRKHTYIIIVIMIDETSLYKFSDVFGFPFF